MTAGAPLDPVAARAKALATLSNAQARGAHSRVAARAEAAARAATRAALEQALAAGRAAPLPDRDNVVAPILAAGKRRKARLRRERVDARTKASPDKSASAAAPAGPDLFAPLAGPLASPLASPSAEQAP